MSGKTAPTTISPATLFRGQRRILEGLFPPRWFELAARKNSHHPALLRWKALVEFEKVGFQLPPPGDLRKLREIATILLEVQQIAAASGGDLDSFCLGDFANYGDEAVRARLARVVEDPNHYASVLTELSFAAWHLHEGNRVTANEDEGLADFVVQVPSLELPLIADCKRLSADSVIERVPKVVKKANKQIKAYGQPAFGVVVVELSDWLPDSAVVHHIPDPDVHPPNDKIPSEVDEAANRCRSILARHNRSVNATLLVWNEYSMLGPYPKTGHADFFLIRRSLQIAHEGPLHMPSSCPAIHLGSTVLLRCTYQTRSTPADVR